MVRHDVWCTWRQSRLWAQKNDMGDERLPSESRRTRMRSACVWCRETSLEAVSEWNCPPHRDRQAPDTQDCQNRTIATPVPPLGFSTVCYSAGDCPYAPTMEPIDDWTLPLGWYKYRDLPCYEWVTGWHIKSPTHGEWGTVNQYISDRLRVVCIKDGK